MNIGNRRAGCSIGIFAMNTSIADFYNEYTPSERHHLLDCLRKAETRNSSTSDKGNAPMGLKSGFALCGGQVSVLRVLQSQLEHFRGRGLRTARCVSSDMSWPRL